VEARFNRTAEIDAMGFAHPLSDLVEKDGSITVACPGLDRHPIRKIIEPSGDNMGVRATQMGHYGMLWRNKSQASTDLDVRLTFSPATQVIITGSNAKHYLRD
jgi:hypothetical protein